MKVLPGKGMYKCDSHKTLTVSKDKGEVWWFNAIVTFVIHLLYTTLTCLIQII